MTTFDATNILPKGEPDLYSRELKVDDVMIFFSILKLLRLS